MAICGECKAEAPISSEVRHKRGCRWQSPIERVDELEEALRLARYEMMPGRPTGARAGGIMVDASDAERYERKLAQETLIFEATEEICRVMGPDQDSGEITRKQLAERLGKSKSHVTQLLSGERNLTLRTLADLAGALGHRAVVRLEPIPAPPGGCTDHVRPILEAVAAALSDTEEEGQAQPGCERCEHIAAEALAMAEELEGQPMKRRFRSVEEIKREFFPALHAEEQRAAREGEPAPEVPAARNPKGTE